MTSLGCVGLNERPLTPSCRRGGRSRRAAASRSSCSLVVLRSRHSVPRRKVSGATTLPVPRGEVSPEQDLRVGAAGVRQAALAGDEELAVDPRRQRRVRRGRVLRHQELRLVGLVPDRPGVDLRAVVAPDGGHERLELLRARARDVVAGAVRRPARDRARDRQQHLPAARLGGVDDGVVRAPVVARRDRSRRTSGLTRESASGATSCQSSTMRSECTPSVCDLVEGGGARRGVERGRAAPRRSSTASRTRAAAGTSSGQHGARPQARRVRNVA